MFSFLEFIVESKGSVGQLTSHRGKLNEMGFVHAFERYNHFMDKHNGNHNKAMEELSKEPHLKGSSDHPYTENIKKISKDIGEKETDRTLWDSHHAAMSVINHINKTRGIKGPAIWTGSDVSGETVRKITGVNTQGDILIPTKTGGDFIIKRSDNKSSDQDWVSGSMKYHGDLSKSPTKLYQGTTDKSVEAIQKHHVENFGKRDEELDKAHESLKSSFQGVDEKLKNKSSELLAAGFTPNKKGYFSKSNVSDMARYANELTDLKNKNVFSERRAILQKRFEDRFDKAKINSKDRDKHIQNLTNIHNDVIKGDKVKSSQNFALAFHNALKKSYTEGNTGQHNLVKELTNIRDPKEATVLIMKTQRNHKIDDYRGREQEALPKIYIGNHGEELSKIASRGKEKELFDATGPKANSASTTIGAKNHKKIASFSIDTGKSSPSIVAQAGEEIDKFNDVSHLHPWNDENSTTSTTTTSPTKPSSLINNKESKQPSTFFGKQYHSPSELQQ